MLIPATAQDCVHVNVFNISKINRDVTASQKKGGLPRIKRLAEYIGESYFEYLASLPDLVLLMDEAHRYRADAGMKAINELDPILGLELTATPFVESNGGPVWFKNIAYSYPLSQAIEDGFVKEPAVATRKDFNAAELSPDKIERIKLEDGVRLHEQVKADLRIYASEQNVPAVKPFLLVIARDTNHAGDLLETIRSKGFFEGRYADRVIEVHSKTKGLEKEENVQRLLDVENPDEPTEIVVHVNMLKEGWDVTNLYTIVPLRAANARTLIEQSIGRGLRLPYGRRTGVKAVDRLTIVAHDKFQEVVDEANRPDSIIRRIEKIILDEDGPEDAPKPVEVQPVISQVLSGEIPAASLPLLGRQELQGGTLGEGADRPTAQRPTFDTPEAKAIAIATYQVIGQEGGLASSKILLQPEMQKKILRKVKIAVPKSPEGPSLPGLVHPIDSYVEEATADYVSLSIDIPAITYIQTGDVTIGFDDFILDTSGLSLQAVNSDILIQHLQSHERDHLAAMGGGVKEARLEDHVVRALVGFDDVDYDSHSELLYALADQVVAHLRSYLSDDEDVRNVLMYFQAQIGHIVHNQMVEHSWEKGGHWQVKVLSGHRHLKPAMFLLRTGQEPLSFRVPVDEKRKIRQMVFSGFRKCLYSLQKFDSDSERRFSALLENDTHVHKWVKPARGNFQIQFRRGDMYEPDFVVETDEVLYLAEVKQRNQVTHDEVLAKAEGAIGWCSHATDYTKTTGGKPWRYVLIPDDAVLENMSLAHLAQQFGK
jgi:type III restriction enzyme